MDTTTLHELLDRYASGQITPAEQERLLDLIADPLYKEDAEEWIGVFVREAEPVNEMDETTAQEILQSILDVKEEKKPVTRMKTHWWWAAAAILLIAIGFGIYRYQQSNDPPVITNVQVVPAPVANRATITLDNGQIVYLDKATNGILINEGNVQVEKTADGKIKYSGNSNEVLYNTLSNPRGSKVIDMTLADGSRVWLNAGSSVRYPVAFTGNKREVSMTGEAYFEVAHDASKPFLVSKEDMQVEVLGTQFNVNTYADEPSIKVTLLEGSVKVNSGMILRPGEQAEINRDVVRVHKQVNIEAVVAWKNGLFQFEGADLYIVMRQLSRWYDLDVRYEGNIPTRSFEGKIQRGLNLNDVLDALAKNQVHYRVAGKTLTITP